MYDSVHLRFLADGFVCGFLACDFAYGLLVPDGFTVFFLLVVSTVWFY